jgi:hypothetical protein
MLIVNPLHTGVIIMFDRLNEEMLNDLLLASDDEFEPYGMNQQLIDDMIYEETVELRFEMDSLSSQT